MILQGLSYEIAGEYLTGLEMLDFETWFEYLTDYYTGCALYTRLVIMIIMIIIEKVFLKY